MADDEIAEFAAQPQEIAESVLISKGLRIAPNMEVQRRYGSWAAALLAEATRRADDSTAVVPAVADALIAARNLVSACQRTDS